MRYLEFLRRQRRLSQVHVAQATHLHRNVIVGVEAGRLNPTPGELRALANFFQVEPDRLLTHVADPFDGTQAL